jgi:hypothetical protein
VRAKFGKTISNADRPESGQPTECGKHLVADMVPVPIVEALEAIEIKHNEGCLLVFK